MTLGFALASMFIKPNDKDIISLFGLLFPYIYFTTLLIVPFTYRRQKVTFFLGCILLIFGLKSILSYVRPDIHFNKDQGNVHVLSFNVMKGTMLVDKAHQFTKERQELFNRVVRQVPIPDIICAQEVNELAKSAFDTAFEYPYSHQIEQRGATIITRFPIIRKGQVDFGPRLNSCLWADLLINATDTIRVYSLHLESNRLSQSSYAFNAKEGYEAEEAIRGLKDLITKYPRYAGKRGNQAEMVKKHINSSPYPVIICGDLNDPPMSYTYRTLKKGLNDTFLDTGGGFGTTWTGAIPMLRIDYIFASKEIENTAFYCLESELSDHFPVKASFNIN